MGFTKLLILLVSRPGIEPGTYRLRGKLNLGNPQLVILMIPFTHTVTAKGEKQEVPHNPENVYILHIYNK